MNAGNSSPNHPSVPITTEATGRKKTPLLVARGDTFRQNVF